MSNNKKRKLKAHKPDEPHSKRRKLNEHDTIRHDLFDNANYVQEFSTIYNCIKISLNSIPNNVVYEISQFATGEMHPCDNPKCENEVLLLEQDRTQSNEERDFFYHVPKHHDKSKINLNEYVEYLDDVDQMYFDDNVTIQIFCSDCKPKLTGCDMYSKDDFGNGRVYVVCSGRLVLSDATCECGGRFLMCAQHTVMCKDCNVTKCVPTFVSHQYQCEFHRTDLCRICGKERCVSWMEWFDSDGMICKEHCTYHDVTCSCNPYSQPPYRNWNFVTYKTKSGHEVYEDDCEWTGCSRCPRGICYRCCDLDDMKHFMCLKTGCKQFVNLCIVCFEKDGIPKCKVCMTMLLCPDT